MRRTPKGAVLLSSSRPRGGRGHFLVATTPLAGGGLLSATTMPNPLLDNAPQNASSKIFYARFSAHLSTGRPLMDTQLSKIL